MGSNVDNRRRAKMATATSTLTNYYPHSKKNALPELMLSLCHETSTLYYLSNPTDPSLKTLEERARDLIDAFSFPDCLCEEGESESLYAGLTDVKEEIRSKVEELSVQFELHEEQVAIYEELSPSKSSLMKQQTLYRHQQFRDEANQRKEGLEELFASLEALN